jgi:hypothetical protein
MGSWTYTESPAHLRFSRRLAPRCGRFPPSMTWAMQGGASPLGVKP